MTPGRDDPTDGSAGPSTDGASTGGAGRRGLVLVAGGSAVLLVVEPVGPLVIFWIPLLVGLVFVAAAAVTGRRSPLWGPGLVVSAYGTAEVLELLTDVPGSGGWTTAAIGLGGLLAAFLGGRGYAMSAASVAAPVVFLGVGQWIAATASRGTITWCSAGVTVLYGLVELGGRLRSRHQAS